ncbi:hypothetical protein ACFCXK_31865 [Streptomyces sp. NPDC056269]|uniref:hypothetical protein n=1 Tax=Streptomyces sp. NPDC056269 TaxID=3345768 RepID=UPI0035D8B91D
MTDTQILFLGFGLVATAIVAVVGSQLAPADANSTVVPPKRRWNWAAGAAFATVVTLGLLFQSLGLDEGPPSGVRIGGVGIGVLCAALAALVAYVLNGDEARGPRWRIAGVVFTAGVTALAVVVMIAV